MADEFPQYNPGDFEPEANYGEEAMAEASQNGEAPPEPKHGRLGGLAHAASGMAHSVGSHLHLTSHNKDHGFERAQEDEDGERGHRSHFSLNPLNAIDSAWVRGKNVAHGISNAVHHHGHHHDAGAWGHEEHHHLNPLSAMKNAASSAAHSIGSHLHVPHLHGNKGHNNDAEGASASSTSFTLGQKVERRDHGEDWGAGFVVQLDPLMVTCDDDDPSAEGYEWAEVRVLSEVVESRHEDPPISNVVPTPPSPLPAEDTSIHSELPLLTDEVCQQHIPELAVPMSIIIAEPSWWKCCAPALQNRPKKSSAHAGGVYVFDEGNCSFYCREVGKELFDGA